MIQALNLNQWSLILSYYWSNDIFAVIFIRPALLSIPDDDYMNEWRGVSVLELFKVSLPLLLLLYETGICLCLFLSSLSCVYSLPSIFFISCRSHFSREKRICNRSQYTFMYFLRWFIPCWFFPSVSSFSRRGKAHEEVEEEGTIFLFIMILFHDEKTVNPCVFFLSSLQKLHKQLIWRKDSDRFLCISCLILLLHAWKFRFDELSLTQQFWNSHNYFILMHHLFSASVRDR